MCRLLGCASLQNETIDQCCGRPVLDKLITLSHLHKDGWGTTWSKKGMLQTYKSALPCYLDANAQDCFTSTPSNASIVHLRLASPDNPIGLDSTHPFTDNVTSFAHNGTISPRQKLQSLCSSSLDDGATASTGGIDSELYYNLIRREAGYGKTYRSATVSAVRKLRMAFPHASLNAMLLTPHSLLVISSHSQCLEPYASYSSKEIEQLAIPPSHIHGYYTMYQHINQSSVMFSSSGLNGEDWEQIDDETVTEINLSDLTRTTITL